MGTRRIRKKKRRWNYCKVTKYIPIMAFSFFSHHLSSLHSVCVYVSHCVVYYYGSLRVRSSNTGAAYSDDFVSLIRTCGIKLKSFSLNG